MVLARSIIAASDTVWDTFLGGSKPLLNFPGFKRNDKKHFFEAVFALVKDHNGDFIRTNTTTSNLDYGGWFNYFYREARKAMSKTADSPDAREFGRIFSLLFELTLDPADRKKIKLRAGALPAGLSAQMISSLNQTPGGTPKDILEHVFKKGFREATTSNAGSYFSTDLALKSNLTTGASIRSQTGSYVFAYRGDTRAPETVKQHKGAMCRAELDFWKEDAHVNDAWHPWSGADGPLKKMWFREGSKDNDYFTLNSLAKDFHISCAYPMFKSFEINQVLKGPASGWDEAKRKALLGSGVKIVSVFNTKTNAMEEVLSDDGCIYICTLLSDSTIAKTWELAKYPESGVRNVGLEDMLAYIKIKRYHRPPESDGEFYDSTRVDPSMTIKTFSWNWVRTEAEARATLGCTEGGMKPITAKLNGLMNKLFDISHTKKYDSATYNPNIKAVPQRAKEEPRRVRLTGR